MNIRVQFMIGGECYAYMTQGLDYRNEALHLLYMFLDDTDHPAKVKAWKMYQEDVYGIPVQVTDPYRDLGFGLPTDWLDCFRPGKWKQEDWLP